jgi:serine/threonine protein kinase
MNARDYPSPPADGPLTPERYQRLHELVDEAFECPPGRRRAFLAGTCGTDAALLSEALGLLDAREALEPPDGAVLIGSRVGPYRVERELGRGGMGAVYLARRVDDVFDKQVAIKVINPEMANAEVMARFKLETRILAALEHPNIARLMDAGVMDDGRPFIIMEHVDGISITQYADRSRLSVVERIALFRTVCTAVSYAHHKQIVHRDIKPTNILVTADGTPKLLDFGIAKLLTAGPEDGTPLTATHLAPGTPRYASPEQLSGGQVDARADVYALGVVLFELVAGWWPFVATRPGGEIVTKPSDVITPAGEQRSIVGTERVAPVPDAIAAARGTTPAGLLLQLRGDLDAVVLAALREDSQERYTTVSELSDDLQRHLQRRPVLARPRTARYRASRFIVRHRAGFLIGALAVAGAFVLATVLAIGHDRMLGSALDRTGARPDRSNDDRRTDGRPSTSKPSSQREMPSGRTATLSEGTPLTTRAAGATGARPPTVSPGETRGPISVVPPPQQQPSSGQLDPTATRADETGGTVAGAGIAGGGSSPVTSAPNLPADSSVAAKDVIVSLLQRFADAHNRGSTPDIKTLYPSLTPEQSSAIERAWIFEASHEMQITDCHVKVAVGGDSATATCGMVQRITSSSGTLKVFDGPAVFRLARSNGIWVITSAPPQ